MTSPDRDRPTGETSGSAQRAARQHAAPILTFDLSAELDQLRGEETYRVGDRDARTLVKTDDLRIVLVAVHAGGTIREHHAPGSVSVHAVAGHLRLHAGGKTIDLPSGHLLTFGAGVAHDVEALEDSAFLLTVAWPSDRGDSD